MKSKKLLMLLVTVCALLVTLSFSVSAQTTDGWAKNPDGTWSYYENGYMVTDDWREDSSGLCYLDYNGVVLTNDFAYYLGNTCYVDGSGHMVKKNWAFHDNEWYYFDANGYLVTNSWIPDSKGWCYVDDNGNVVTEQFVNDSQGTCYVDENGYIVTNKWVNAYDGWYYLDANGHTYVECVKKIGGAFYGFDYSGRMYDSGEFSIYDENLYENRYYYAGNDGKLLTNKWLQHYIEYGDEDWRYYGAYAEAYRNEVRLIYGSYYCFDSDSWMVADGTYNIESYDEANEVWIVDASYRAKADGKLYVNQWYLAEWGDWYYYGAGGKAAQGAYSVKGTLYCFDAYGRMVENQTVQIITSSGTKYYYADENSYPYELYNNKWTYADDAWFYVQNGALCNDGLYTIGGTTYGFDWQGRMYDDEIFNIGEYDDELDDWEYKYYYAKPGGKLAINEWVKPYEYSDNWYYYGADGAAPAQGLTQIGGYYFYFLYDDGEAATAQIIEDLNGKVWVFDKGAYGKAVSGWFKSPYEGLEDEWMYAKSDGYYAYDEIIAVSGKLWAFDSDGYLEGEGIVEYYNPEVGYSCYYAIASNGSVVTTDEPIWHKVDGNWVLINSDDTLYEGWKQSGSTWYYFDPYMSYCDMLINDGMLYGTNINGTYYKLTATGLYHLYGDSVYVENGKLLTNNWKKIDGAWYFFDSYGYMVKSESYYVPGDAWYYFDATGKMASGGWIHANDGSWYWADSNGRLFTHAIDSSGYVFDYYGRLCADETVYMNGVYHITNSDGKTIGTLSKEGWNKIGADWYYVVDGDYVYDESTYEIDGDYYGFDYEGKMYHDCEKDGRYYGSSGRISTGWFKIDGEWAYGNSYEYNYGYLSSWGIYYIDGKEYLFDNHRLQTNATTLVDDRIVCTNGDGEVVSETKANGWIYESSDGYGRAHYYKDGKAYDGWVGDYYIDDGYLCIDCVIYDDYYDKYYYLGKDGLCVKNQWIEDYGDWVLAKAGGALYYDEWYWNGSSWFYFDGYYMAYDGVYEIDGVKYLFAESGAYLGVAGSSSYADGWQKINGKWYFYMAGEMVTYDTLYVDGKWYAFGHDGVMKTNTFYGSYYYGADGARKNYTGWQQIGGKWMYFDIDHSYVYGWVLDGGKYYYLDITDDSPAVGGSGGMYVTAAPTMVTGYHQIDGKLCYFNSDGSYWGTVTESNWYKSGSDWYLILSGELIYGETVYTGGAYYAFDYDGKMISNGIYDGYYYGADGKRVTSSGWYKLGGKWIYIDANSNVCRGIHLIGGKEYYFDGYFLVE